MVTKEATGVDVEPIYYSAGYKDGEASQNPYNLSKLLLFILRHTKEEKRAVFVQDVNKNKAMWGDNDSTTYGEEIKKTWVDSLVDTIGTAINVVSTVVDYVSSPITSVIKSVGRFFSSWW